MQHDSFSSPAVTGSKIEQRHTSQQTLLSDESRQVITSRAATKSQIESTAADSINSVGTDLMSPASLPQEESRMTRREVGSPVVSYSMQFEESEATGTAEEMETEGKRELDEVRPLCVLHNRGRWPFIRSDVKL